MCQIRSKPKIEVSGKILSDPLLEHGPVPPPLETTLIWFVGERGTMCETAQNCLASSSTYIPSTILDIQYFTEILHHQSGGQSRNGFLLCSDGVLLAPSTHRLLPSKRRSEGCPRGLWQGRGPGAWAPSAQG